MSTWFLFYCYIFPVAEGIIWN